MRTWILAIVLIAACKGKDKGTASKEAAKAALTVPKVQVATVLAKDDGKPPFLVIIEGDEARLAAAATWAELDAGKLKITKKANPLDRLDRYIREDFAMGKQPSEIVTSMNEFADSDGVEIDLTPLEDTSTAQDDPPPPEDEDLPEEDEHGGTGTAIALDEGKMGKRAEGQYKMKKNVEDPQLARQQAIEQARAAGILGGTPSGAGLGFGNFVANEDGTPSRAAQVQGSIPPDGKLDPLRTMIFIAPTVKATKLIDAIRVTQGAIAVSHAGKIRPLRVQFMSRDLAGTPKHWLEARVSSKGITVEAVPDVPIEVSDLKELSAALDKARSTRDADHDAPVDVLVDADIDVQRLIDVLVTLDTGGVRTIGLGAMPSADELARRGRRIPTATIGNPNAQGDLDKKEIRRVVRSAQPKILECYTKALADNPGLEGTVQTQFFIQPDGKVHKSASASGVDPQVATCVATVLKGLEFPKPAGGGGVQVNYPFTLRP